MGNENGIPFKQWLDVGNNVNQHLTRKHRFCEDHTMEKIDLRYYVGITSSTVLLSCETGSDKDGVCKFIRFEFNNPGLITIWIKRDDNPGLITVDTRDFQRIDVFGFGNESKDSSGEVTKTNVAYKYNRSEDEGSLLVVEQKRKSGVEKPYVVTVAHYFAISRHSLFGLRTYVAGLSVTVNVTVLNNELDFVFSHSHNHSPGVLLPMFQHVCRTRIWKWDTCPYRHAAETRRKQSIHMGRRLLKTNTETETEKEEGSYVQSTKQIGSNVVANQGMVIGENNCNVVVNKVCFRGRK